MPSNNDTPLSVSMKMLPSSGAVVSLKKSSSGLKYNIDLNESDDQFHSWEWAFNGVTFLSFGGYGDGGGGVPFPEMYVDALTSFVRSVTFDDSVFFNGNLSFNSPVSINDELQTTGLFIQGGRHWSGWDTVASTSDLTLGNTNNNSITGTTTINRISTDNWLPGSKITLNFESNVTLTHGAVASLPYVGLRLASGASFNATANDNITFILNKDGTFWHEVSRTVL